MSNNKAGDLGNAKSSNKEAIKIHITTHDMANIDSQKELISNFLIFIKWSVKPIHRRRRGLDVSDSFTLTF